jgi:ubiquinone/menaquinone biosynthesis C-methylase UbiE
MTGDRSRGVATTGIAKQRDMCRNHWSARLAAGRRVLDLACGTGTLALWIKQRHPDLEVNGIDAAPAPRPDRPDPF